MDFKFIDKLTLDANGFNTGPVPVSTFLLGDTESHKVVIEKGPDYDAEFGFYKSVKQILHSGASGVYGYVSPDQSLTSGTSNTDILIGPPARNLIGTLTDSASSEFIIYDLIDNKPFTDFDEVDSTHILLGAQAYKDNVLVYRTSSDEERFVEVDARYVEDVDWDINGGGTGINFLNADFIPGNQVTIMNNPVEQTYIQWSDREYFKKWNIYLPRKTELGVSSTIALNSTSTRHLYIENETVKKVKSRLIQTRHKGIDVSGAENFYNNGGAGGTTTFDQNYGYIKLKDSKGSHYNKKVWSIDAKRGYILFEDPIKNGLIIDYKVDNSWFPFSPAEINLNPLQHHSLTYYIWIHNKTKSLYWSNSDNKAALKLQNSVFPSYVLTDAYSHIFTVSLRTSKSHIIDSRVSGGVLKDQDPSVSDLKSFTDLGYWGVEPTGMNIVVIDLPDNVLENMVNQFHEKGVSAYGLSFPADMGEDRSAAINYLNTFANANEVNLIKNEIFDAINRYIPLGMSIIIRDSEENILFGTEDPALVTTSLGIGV